MSTEQVVQLAPDGAGKKLRTLEITTVLADGTIATVEMQVIAVADAAGRLLNVSLADELLQQILIELRALKELLCLEGVAIR